MNLSLDGRTAIITGGSKGLGFATAHRFVASGANVAILARNPETLRAAESRLQELSSGRAKGFRCDVSIGSEVEGAYAEVMTTFGRVDILVNNAGEGRSGPVEEVTDQMWLDDMNQKLLAVVRFVRLVWPQMKDRRWGRIINVLSVSARTQQARNAPSGVMRAAGLAYTNVLSKEGAPHNILVNAILSGKIVTDQIARRHQSPADLESAILQRGGKLPLGRMGTAEEFANVACFLASEASSYVAGAAIAVDGGLSPAI